jgi:hypothetical protein
MNYTFAHLHCLIAWLFDTPVHYANGKNGLGDAEDYPFGVKSKAKLYSPLYKPGQLKGGVRTVKLSNVRDPGRWRSGYGTGIEDGLSESEDEEMVPGESQADAEEVDCIWVNEEDYTLVHRAWPAGLDPTTGIIYVSLFFLFCLLCSISDRFLLASFTFHTSSYHSEQSRQGTHSPISMLMGIQIRRKMVPEHSTQHTHSSIPSGLLPKISCMLLRSSSSKILTRKALKTCTTSRRRKIP